MKLAISIPEPVERCLLDLHKSGYSAHVVGGCVRDALMGRDPHDWDVCTSALPEEAMEVFAADRVIPTGLQHGTITLVLGGIPIEITTLRRDGDYLDHRRPASVSFTDDLLEDLARRDFTVNAMAYCPEEGLTNPFGGGQDLENQILRCVGEPQTRFEEDALRILRLFRFISQLGFAPEPETLRAVEEKRALLGAVSAERISAELDRIVMGDNVYNALVLMRDSGVLGEIIPEFVPTFRLDQRTPYHDRTVDLHIFSAVAAGKKKLAIRLALLFHDIGKPDVFFVDEAGRGHCPKHPAASASHAKKIMKRLKYPAKLTNHVVKLVLEHGNKFPPEEKALRHAISKHGEEFVRDALWLKEADDIAHSPLRAVRIPNYGKAREMMEEILASGVCLGLNQLAVNGSDLMAAGVPAGRELGQVLNSLLDLVLDDPVKNQKGILLSEVKYLLQKS